MAEDTVTPGNKTDLKNLQQLDNNDLKREVELQSDNDDNNYIDEEGDEDGEYEEDKEDERNEEDNDNDNNSDIDNNLIGSDNENNNDGSSKYRKLPNKSKSFKRVKEQKDIQYSENLNNFLEKPPSGLSYIEDYNTFEIRNLSDMMIPGERYLGPEFTVGNYKFNLILVAQKKNSFVFSVYLEGHPLDEKEGEIWSFPVQFALQAWDPDNYAMNKHNRTRFRYNQRVTDWGFVSFIDSRNSVDANFFKNDKVNITAYVRVIDDFTHVLYSDFRDYDSKKITGYVGIENQGATCYLNSLLQSYFFTKNFRKKVYQIPTEDEIRFDFDTYEEYKNQPNTVSLALQRIFYKLQTSDVAITSKELTHSFGWTTADAFQQHDVQELNRILMDRLETKMKGTNIDGCLNDIFVGKMKSFIRCIDVDYESFRVEDFWDIQLNVKGLKNIQEAFENYVELELLNGDNKYDASAYGLQDAEKGVIFESFPDVLHVQLKRYEYDFEIDNMVKINDRYEFSNHLDLKPYISKTSENYNENWEYKLHCVLVHQGDVSIGHYYAMIKPNDEDKWFKFDDERVSRVTEETVFDEGFGRGPPQPYDRSMSRDEYQMHVIKHQTSAYMLVYVRESKLPEILAEVKENDIPPHISKQVEYEKEQELKIKKEREEMHLYVNFQIYTDKTFGNYEGFDIGPNPEDRQQYNEELYNPESFPLTFRILKSEPLSSIYEKLVEILGKDSKMIDKLRLWNIYRRSNNTFRVDRPIEAFIEDVEDCTVGTIGSILSKSVSRRRLSDSDAPIVLSLYLEDPTKDLKYLAKNSNLISTQGNYTNLEKYNLLVNQTDGNTDACLEPILDTTNIILFIKYFSYENQSITGLSHIIIPQETNSEFLNQILRIVLYISDDEQLLFYEELDPTKRFEIKNDKSFYSCEISYGDIICVSKKHQLRDDKNVQFKNFEECYKFMETKVHFILQILKRIGEDEEDYVFIEDSENLENVKDIDVWLSYNSSYSDIQEVIGNHISVAPEYIKLCTYSNDKKVDLKSTFDFSSYLCHASKKNTYTIFYEVLKFPLLQFEKMDLYTVYWVGNGICKEERHEFFLPMMSTVDQLVTKLESKINIDSNTRENLFGWFFEAPNKIKSAASLDDILDKKYPLVLGNFPQYKEYFQKNNVSKEVILINALQFYGSCDNLHGLPFFFDIIKNEPYESFKARLQKILGISDKEFNAARIGITNMSYTEYFDVSDTNKLDLYSLFGKNSLYLAIDHPDRSRRVSHASSIMIKN